MSNQKRIIIDTYRDKNTTETFDKSRSKYAFQRYKHKIEANFLKKTLLEIKKDKLKILDVACGTGRMLPEIFSVGKEIEYIGFDSSKEMTKYLEKKSNNMNIEKNVKIKIGDASEMPFEDGGFDVVYSFHLLWHLPKKEQEKIIKEMLRVCKKGGFVVFDILNKDFVYEKFKGLFGKRKTEKIYKLSVNEVKKIIGNKRFDIEKLSDAPIKNHSVYKIFNAINHSRKILPQSLYHMIFLKVKK
jgi:ubiquinone/menaquinone biosynthesis C-methylase UbiE